MPAPLVYVACAIGTVAAVVAFKEFVYDPHIAPTFEAWAQAAQARRDARRRSAPVPSGANNTGRQNENEARRDLGKRRSVTPENDNMSVELENLVAREAAEWRSAPSSRAASLRQRKVNNAATDVMEESNVFIPYDPMAPSQVLFDTSDTESTRSFKSALSPAPQPLSVTPSSGPALRNSPSPRTTAPKTSRPPSALRARAVSPGLPTPVSRSPASSRATSPTDSQMYHSASSASSFTPAVVGPLRVEDGSSRSSSRTASSIDVLSDAGRSTGTRSGSGSRTGSRVTSPFSEIRAPQVLPSPLRQNAPPAAPPSNHSDSPLILSPSVGSDFSLPSDTDEGLEHMMLSPSLRSGMFSPSVDLAREMHDDPFEVGSETESWDSFGRRTPEL